ncbi:MAG TPA: hypothetical protein VMI35_00965 [Puia sp.]|nr:hypothetical protein [Puia sp.]
MRISIDIDGAGQSAVSTVSDQAALSSGTRTGTNTQEGGLQSATDAGSGPVAFRSNGKSASMLQQDAAGKSFDTANAVSAGPAKFGQAN